jgi:hypothetical protein
MTENNAPYAAGQPDDPKASRELYRQEGPTTRLITLYLNGDGDVVIASIDSPSEAIRSSVTRPGGEYEYSTTAPAAAKDQLLLALLAERYRGNPGAVEAFRRWCESKGVPCSFYVH